MQRTKCSYTQVVSQLIGFGLGFVGLYFNRCRVPSTWGIKSLHLWWISKIKNNHFSTCCNAIVFSRLDILFPPLWGGSYNREGGLSNILLAKGHLPTTDIFTTVYWCNFRSARPPPSECNGEFWWLENDNQEVIFQITLQRETFVDQWNIVTIQQVRLLFWSVLRSFGHNTWAGPCNRYAMSYDPSNSELCHNA